MPGKGGFVLNSLESMFTKRWQNYSISELFLKNRIDFNYPLLFATLFYSLFCTYSILSLYSSLRLLSRTH